MRKGFTTKSLPGRAVVFSTVEGGQLRALHQVDLISKTIIILTLCSFGL